ncbi:FAD-dependent oxidoreductase [Acidovorax sp. A1169]|uniref:FAD-dependent oxidoreductase n=1 Tax=Acidovorax sp. A1169 TaxID=3059524 RepID=UPI0035210E19
MADSIFRSSFTVAVIGAGPIGLAAAAHLVGRGLAVEVFEAGAGVAAHLQSYGHVRLFSPWRYNVDTAARALWKALAGPCPISMACPRPANWWSATWGRWRRTGRLRRTSISATRCWAFRARASTRSRRPDGSMRTSC